MTNLFFYYIKWRFDREQRLVPQETLAGAPVWYPIPPWLRRILARYPKHLQILMYARLVRGKKVYDGVPKEVACANTVTGIMETVDPTFFGDKNTVNRINGTYTLSEALAHSSRFKRVTKRGPRPGDIVVNPTGKGPEGAIGHTGFVDFDLGVLSNNSLTGKVEKVYSTWDEWQLYFRDNLGIPTELYEIVY